MIDIIQAVGRAIHWAEYLEAHARRIYGLGIGTLLEAKALAKHIMDGDLEDGFAARSVYRRGWSYLTTKEAAECALEQLVVHGWLAEDLRPTRGRSAAVYLINPEIWKHPWGGTDKTDKSPPTAGMASAEGPGFREERPERTDRTDRRISGESDG